VSALLGAVGGLVLAEVIAFSLLEISVTFAFSIIFGIGFCLLGIALSWRIWKSVPGMLKKGILLAFAALVLASGISCFFLEEKWFANMKDGAKTPLYALLGVSFAFSLTFSFSELLALQPCDRCCNTNMQNNPIFGSPQQVFGLFATSLSMGLIFGLLFGFLDVEHDGPDHKNLELNTAVSIPIGVIVGALFGAINQWYRDRQSYQEVPEHQQRREDDSKF